MKKLLLLLLFIPLMSFGQDDIKQGLVIDYYDNNVRVTNVVVQFIRDDKLFTLIGSAFPENFSNYHKQFLKTFETFKL